MNQKRKLKPWVKTFLLLIPELLIIFELFLICNYLNKIVENQPEINVYTIVEGRLNNV